MVKIGTATEMPPKKTWKYNIDWRKFAESLQRGDVLTITCDSKEEARAIAKSGASSIPRYLMPHEKLIRRKVENKVYFKVEVSPDNTDHLHNGHAAAEAEMTATQPGDPHELE